LSYLKTCLVSSLGQVPFFYTPQSFRSKMDAQTSIQDRLTLLEERLSSIEVSLKALQRRVENAERRQEELEEALDQLRDEIEDCVADTTYLFDSIEEIQDDLDEMKK